MVLDRVEEAGSVTKAVAVVAPEVEVGRGTLRRWVSQRRVDAGLKDCSTSEELAEMKWPGRLAVCRPQFWQR
ncbi:hypothetical protein [uncultured Arsenicicoccus sp.]|uniref:hypothetical protein n=1 Tax=uncultured Arsenicicoccus sp. TaxID=491339 RepID=UPI00259576C2|nr:hypothetical protein [uncultured Arsenicicoccus sp.]